MQRVSGAVSESGQTVRTPAGNGRRGTAGGESRQRTSSGRTGRCCRRDVTVPALSTLESFDPTARGLALITADLAPRSELCGTGLEVEECRKIARPVVAHALRTCEFGCTP
eukprot:2704830-Prymnesium_polylepis.1